MRHRAKQAPKSRRTMNQVRIIAGSWRGRKLSFPHAPGLRPTPDRVRETLFNWLRAAIPGSHCLDLFAGSGVLGFEALSRGAQQVSFVEASSEAANYLRQHIEVFDIAEHADLVCMDALTWLKGTQQQYDIIFVDPPYGQGLLESVLTLMVSGNILKPGGLVYLEHERDLHSSMMPQGWVTEKSRLAGQVCYSLWRSPG